MLNAKLKNTTSFFLRPPPPFVGFLSLTNCSDWCLSLVFFPFNPFWLAGALKNYILGTLDLLKNDVVFFSLAFSIYMFVQLFGLLCKLRHFISQQYIAAIYVSYYRIHTQNTQNTYTEYIHGANTQESAVFRVSTPQKSKLQ